ncbi:MAG: response regulator [Clostridia bacterium]|nr:response regulator [Clostridia bacterium]
MYKLLLVDDEPEICEGLQKVVDLEALGFIVVGTARSGMQALEIAEVEKPDVVITDIRMPILDGLSMAAKMKKTLPMVRFIVLSGYDDFEYARKAIELTALRYLLKPISSREIAAVLAEVRQILDDEFTRARDINRLRSSFASSLPLLREAVLFSMATGNGSHAELLESAARYGMYLDGASFTLALARWPRNGGAENDLFDGDPELMSFAVENIASEVLSGSVRHHLFHFGDTLAILLLPEQSGLEGLSQAVDILEETRASVQRFLCLQAHIGISTIVPELSMLPECVSQAQIALSQAAFYTEGRVLCYTDITPDDHRDAPQTDEQLLRALKNSIRLGNTQLSESMVASLFESISADTPYPIYRAFLFEIVALLLRAAQAVRLTDASLYKALDGLMSCPPASEARKQLLSIIRTCTAAADESRASASLQLARQAIALIETQFMREDLAIDGICRQLHISASYFSALFKKETGKTFLGYLTDLRMEKAMDYLAQGGMKTSEIAQLVGIADPSYFSYIFRKHFGIPPSQVRR